MCFFARYFMPFKWRLLIQVKIVDEGEIQATKLEQRQFLIGLYFGEQDTKKQFGM